jgi:uncharacterized membrane protein YjdF
MADLTDREQRFIPGYQGCMDTQSDMLLCLIGALAALLIIGNIHDKAIEKIKN